MKRRNRHPLPAITRRDFVNGVSVGAGAALLAQSAPGLAASIATALANPPSGAALPGNGWPNEDWYGYGGVGDYRASHGNTPDLVRAAHRLRDGAHRALPDLVPTETVDLAIVGAGLAGLGAALEFAKRRRDGQTCLLFDNHPVFGGESKENEFLVEGQRLLAPQGANGFFVPPAVADWRQAAGDPRYYAELGIPREFDWAEQPTDFPDIRFCNDNYGYLVRGLQRHTSVGHFFADADGVQGRWAVDMFGDALRNAPLEPARREALLAWHAAGDLLQAFPDEAAACRYLDSMSYRQFVVDVLKLGAEGADYANLFLASAGGLGSDVTSAWAARNLPMPGLFDLPPPDLRRTSFPGGNSGFARYFLKLLIPDAIQGEATFEDIVTGGLNAEAFDRPGRPVRMRLNATVVGVRHDGDPGTADTVTVTYEREGELHAVRARAVVMASGGWVNRYVVRDLPQAHREAYGQLRHAPFLVANVALTNWRFLAKLGISAAIWNFGERDFGWTCNLRRPMHVGDYRPPLHPDRPAVLSFYAPFIHPGLPIEAQVAMGRAELFGTTYAQYEEKIVRQMNRLFADSGFDAGRDIAGIILNRWGHALSVPFPGFYGGASGGPGIGDIVRRPHGRIAFGHSELVGLQHWGPAADEGRLAFDRISAAL